MKTFFQKLFGRSPFLEGVSAGGIRPIKPWPDPPPEQESEAVYSVVSVHDDYLGGWGKLTPEELEEIREAAARAMSYAVPKHIFCGFDPAQPGSDRTAYAFRDTAGRCRHVAALPVPFHQRRTIEVTLARMRAANLRDGQLFDRWKTIERHRPRGTPQPRWQCSGCGFSTSEDVGECNGYDCLNGGACDGKPCPGCGRKHYWTGSFERHHP